MSATAIASQRVRSEVRRLHTACADGTLFWVIRHEAHAEDVASIQAELERMLLWRCYVGLVVVVSDSGWLPDRYSRKRTTQLLAELGDDLAFVAVLFEGNGLRTSLLRRFLAALSRPVRRAFPLRVFQCESSLVRWVSAQVHDDQGTGVSAGSLRDLIRDLRG